MSALDDRGGTVRTHLPGLNWMSCPRDGWITGYRIWVGMMVVIMVVVILMMLIVIVLLKTAAALAVIAVSEVKQVFQEIHFYSPGLRWWRVNG